MNIIARLEYELAYYDSAVHRFNHYTTRTPLLERWLCKCVLRNIVVQASIWRSSIITWEKKIIVDKLGGCNILCSMRPTCNLPLIKSFVFFFFFLKPAIIFYIIWHYNIVGRIGLHLLRFNYFLGSIPGRVIPKTLKMVLDTTLLNTQHYKVRFKGKVEQSWEWSSALPYTLV